MMFGFGGRGFPGRIMRWFGGWGGGPALSFKILRALDLSEEQQERLTELKEDSFAKFAHGRIDGMQLHQQLFKALSAENLDREKVLALGKQIKEHKGAMTDLMFANMLQFAEILTPEQRKQLKKKAMKFFSEEGGGDPAYGQGVGVAQGFVHRQGGCGEGRQHSESRGGCGHGHGHIPEHGCRHEHGGYGHEHDHSHGAGHSHSHEHSHCGCGHGHGHGHEHSHEGGGHGYGHWPEPEHEHGHGFCGHEHDEQEQINEEGESPLDPDEPMPPPPPPPPPRRGPGPGGPGFGRRHN